MRKLLAVFTVSIVLFAEESIDRDANWKIRREATENSQVMKILHKLTDRYGPRLTGSPNYEAAARWAMDQMKEWGFQNVHLEPWDFGHPGWLNQKASGFMVSPTADVLTFEVLAWTPSTKGSTVGPVVQLVPPATPTKEELTAWLAANQSKVSGKIVLMGKAAVLPVSFNAPAKRMEDAEAKSRFDPVNPSRPNFPQRPTPPAGKLTPNQATEMIDAWLVANGALVRVNDSGMTHGMIRAFHNRTYDIAKAVPTVVLRNEDFGRIERLLGDGETVKLEFNIENTSYPEGKTAFNVVGEIPGTDKADEIVMLGGHLDSWHSATGATDNGVGSSMMLEAARILKSTGLKPRRTIRVALWDAEEQGLLGSMAYVKEHFGTVENPKPEFAKLDAYFNIDSGTGRVRGASVFGPSEAGDILRAALSPFEDVGVAGAIATSSRNRGGTDHTSFNAAGLPGIGLGQDTIEYQSHTWHTNLDTYERVIPDDVMKSSMVIAAAVWHVANRDQMIPRFSKEKMPEAPKEPAN